MQSIWAEDSWRKGFRQGWGVAPGVVYTPPAVNPARMEWDDDSPMLWDDDSEMEWDAA